MSSANDCNETDEKPGIAGPLVAITSVLLLVAFASMGMPIAFNIVAVIVISVVIWQACDPFADAAQWIGDRFNLPGSVRGATLDAIASSLPELFTGIFFVLTAMSAVGGDSGVSQAEASGEGYGATIATCAGSAVYNMILIPAFVALMISFYRKERPTVDVEDKVIARDGVAFLLCEIFLLFFLFSNQLHWWMGVLFIGAYLIYISLLYTDWKKFEIVKKTIENHNTENAEDVRNSLASDGKKVSLTFVEQVQTELARRGNDEEDEGDEDDAGILFGFASIQLNAINAWLILVISTVIAAAACFFLVEVTHDLSDLLNVPTFFMAVIVAAAASSVPDTFISIGAAMRGDDSGAVSNAFGSNIFDICICLSVPLILNSALNGWQPISLLQNGEPMAGLVGLRILLGVLTAVTLMIMWHNRQLTRTKAFILCGLYCVFIAYAVSGSLGILAL